MKKPRRIKILGGVKLSKDTVLSTEQFIELEKLRHRRPRCDKHSNKWDCWLPKNHMGPCLWWAYNEGSQNENTYQIIDTWNE